MERLGVPKSGGGGGEADEVICRRTEQERKGMERGQNQEVTAGMG